jgi:membrane protein
MSNKILDRIVQNTFVQKVLTFTKNHSLPGFQKVPIYEVSHLFYQGVKNGTFSTRASSLAFKFFFAVFPGIIFLFTLIPIIPVDGFQEELLNFIRTDIPKGLRDIAITTIEDLISTPRGGLLSVNFLLMLYLTTNGIHSLMVEFNNSHHITETRNPFQQRMISIVLALVLTLMLVLSIGLIIVTEVMVSVVESKNIEVNDNLSNALFHAAKWVTVFALYYFAIGILYYFGPAKRKHFKFFSPGSILTTVLLILTSYGFSIYLQYFSTYNKIYGSIGTVMIVMLWFYLNSYILLLGFDVNASIANAKYKKESNTN